MRRNGGLTQTHPSPQQQSDRSRGSVGTIVKRVAVLTADRPVQSVAGTADVPTDGSDYAVRLLPEYWPDSDTPLLVLAVPSQLVASPTSQALTGLSTHLRGFGTWYEDHVEIPWTDAVTVVCQGDLSLWLAGSCWARCRSPRHRSWHTARSCLVGVTTMASTCAADADLGELFVGWLERGQAIVAEAPFSHSRLLD